LLVHVRSAYLSALEGDGHDVTRVVDALDEAASDSESIEYARETGGIVVTNDAKDFSRFSSHPGIIIVPQTGLKPGEVAAAVSRIERMVPEMAGLTLYAADWL
jgi:predicted nuclease of predicted toxin-antitoxin system